MEDNKKDNTFLARWIDGKLSPEELAEFEKSDEYHEYKKIAEASDSLVMPKYDKKKAYRKLLDEIKSERKTKQLVPSWLTGLAASVLIVFGIYFMLRSTKVTTNSGESLVHILPDSSEIVLNSKSKITYNKRSWDKQRSIKLEGEAFFKVRRGAKFEVLANGNTVQVLGTEFNIRTYNNFFEVACFKGKVKAMAEGGEAILLPGQAFRSIHSRIEKYTFDKEIPDWINGEASFVRVPILHVIRALEDNYNLSIEYGNIDLSQEFTGSFSLTDLNLALETVFSAMNITYSMKDRNTIILSGK